jgi:methyl-accepting chemotaxis protein
MTIRTKLISGSVLSVLIILCLAAVNFYSARQSIGALASVYENQVLPAASLQATDSMLKEVRFRIAGVVLDQMTALGTLNHLKDARVSVPKNWAQFKEQTKDNHFTPEGRELIEKIDKQMTALEPFFEKLAAAYAADDKPKLTALLSDDWPPIQKKLLKPLSELVPIQEAAAKSTYEGSVAAGRKMVMIAGILAAASLIVLIVFTVQMVRSIARNIAELNRVLDAVANGDLGIKAEVSTHDELGQMADSLNRTLMQLRSIVSGVKQAADTVTEAAGRLSAEASQVLARAERQSDGVMQVSAAMQQSSVSVTEVAHNATGVENAAAQTQAIAQEGSDNMSKSIDATRRIEEAVQSSSATINGLSQSIDRVGEITKVIKDIADQTNLLALNAAIEAARAGEQGRGFAVVADEVRKLAERTATSTTDIANMVESIKGASGAAVDAISKIEREVGAGAGYNRLTGDTLRRIVEAAVGVADSAHQIAGAVQEQSAASEDIARNMERISALTEENNDSIKQVGGAASDMAGTAAELQRLVGQFNIAG